jgi:hypothetical protein
MFNQHSNSLISILRNIERQRLSDPKIELCRLKSIPFIARRLQNLDISYTSRNCFLQPNIFHKISYGRSLEILDTIKETHFVLNHGQASSCLLSLNLFVSHLYNKKNNIGDEILSNEVKLRYYTCSHSTTYFKNILNINNFNKTKLTDRDHGANLISCDGYLGSIDHAESALSFFLSNSSKDNLIKWKSINGLVDKYIIDERKKLSFIEEFTKLDELIFYNDDPSYKYSGNLYTIIIPKHEFDPIGYISRPLGLYEHYPRCSRNILDDLQMDESVGKEESLQIRLVANKKFSDIKILTFPSRSDDTFFNNVKQMRVLVDKYF